jgi:Tfp pilus assembly protein PilO
MNRSRREVALMSAVVGLLAFAVYNFAFKPQGKELATARSELHAVEQQIGVVNAELNAPVETMPTIGNGLSPAAIPEDPAIPQLLRQLQDLADPRRVTLETITPSQLEENPNGPGGSLTLEVTVSGSHDGNEGFVEGLRDLERLLVVEKIAVIPALPVAGQPTPPEQLQLTIRVYTLRAPVTVEPVTATSAP